jgi:hypothetical protein
MNEDERSVRKCDECQVIEDNVLRERFFFFFFNGKLTVVGMIM